MKEGDIVMFQKEESALDNTWSLATVDQLVQGRDGLSRRAILRYKNFKEAFHRVSDRHVRSVVKVWSVDDQNVDEDLAELQKRLRKTNRGEELVDQLLAAGPQGPDVPVRHHQQAATVTSSSSSCNTCCCSSHCRFGHNPTQKSATAVMRSLLSHRAVDPLADPAHVAVDEVHHDDQDLADEHATSCDCSLTTLMSSLNLNLD